MGALFGGLLSGVGSLVSGIMGARAADDAAKKQAAAGNKAAGIATAAGQQATDAQNQATAAANANSQPFIQAGQGAVSNLSQLMAPGGQLTQGYGQFTAPTAEQAAQTPGYQFQLQQGLSALQNSAAARGGLLSTGTAKNLEQYAQGVASSNYQNTYSNALNAYNTNFNTFNTGQNNLYNRLYGLAGMGANSASSLNSVNQAGANNLTGNMLHTAQLVGNDIMGVGNAQAAGIVGGSNALTGGIQGMANAAGQGITLASLMGAQNASGGAPQYQHIDLNANGSYKGG